jgi:hypothetical protein
MIINAGDRYRALPALDIADDKSIGPYLEEAKTAKLPSSPGLIVK